MRDVDLAIVADRHPASQPKGAVAAQLSAAIADRPDIAWFSPSEDDHDRTIGRIRCVGVPRDDRDAYYLRIGAAAIWPALHNFRLSQH